MKLNLRTISNGLFLIFLGVTFLLLNYGVLPWGFWLNFIRFWPIILIVIGLGLVFNRRVPVSLAFLVLGVLMVTFSIFYPNANRYYSYNYFPFLNSQPVQEKETTHTLDIPLENINKGKIDINAGGAKLNISSTDKGFAAGKVTSYYGNPIVDMQNNNGNARLRLESPKLTGINRMKADEFDIKLTDKIPLDLSIDAGAISGDLDLSKLKLEAVDINVGAADVDIAFGDTKTKVKGDISGGASKISITIPKEVGLKIHYSGIGKIDFNGRSDMTKSGSTYTSENFSTAQTTIELDITAGASKVDINTSNGTTL